MKNLAFQQIMQYAKRLLVIFPFFLFSIQISFAQTNLLTNSGFEDKTNGWTVWGATLANSADAHSGSSAALVSNRKNPWDALARDVTSLLTNGESYTVSAWIKIPSPAVNFRITLALTVDGKTTYTNYCYTASPQIGVYTHYSGTIAVKFSGLLNSAFMYFETESVGGAYSDYLVDDVQLVKINPVVDVIQSGAGWKDIRSTMLVGGCVTEGAKNIFTNAAAKAQVLKDCNTVTIQCYPGWGRWDETKHYVYHVDEFTNEVKEMKKQKMTVTAHMLLGWDQYFPDWYKKNDFPADTLDAIMKSWIKGIISYKGNDTLVDVWNVVNEAISWDGKGGYWPLNNPDQNSACELERMGFEPDASGLTGAQFVNSQHPVYIRKAFEYARTLTKKKLELRDSGFEFPDNGAKYNAFYQLAVHLKKMNAPVDVIGFQTHLDLEKSYDWQGYTNNIRRYVKLGYQVNIPEVDIGDVAKDWNDDKAELQKKQYYNLVTAAIKGGASEFQTWGFIDDGWRPGQKAFPYTANFETKPAYFGIMEALTDMSSVLYWEMDSPENGIMPDVMKYNNFGTLKNFGTPAIVAGYKSKAIQFDGIDDFISSGKLSDSISGNLTFSCFIKTATTRPTILADMALNSKSGLKIGISQDGKIFVDTDGTGLAAQLTGKSTVNDNNWHFVAVQRQGTTYKLYIDDSTPTDQGQGNQQHFNQLIVGAKADGSLAFEGAIDEVKLYDSAIEEPSFVRNFAPNAPTKLTLAFSGMRVKLTWLDQSSNESGFIVERKPKDGDWQEIKRVAVNNTTYVEALTQFNTEYSYRVRSYTSAGKSFESNTVSYLTPKDPKTGLNEPSSGLTVSVFPNPFHEKFNIISSGTPDVKLFDTNGRIWLAKKACNSDEPINLSGIPDGIYFLQTVEGQRQNVIKLVKN